ncbi:MAG TPA: NADH-quinone oxidoreductase subunit K, partial [Mycolicibacterium fallax]|nr:NADH-quinone oxidoreductase subunit K [Mycolicibacterium fallax]
LNLLLLVAGGPSGNPPIRGYSSADQTGTADPLAQAMILTSIVITMGVAAFVLALTYRSYRLTTADDVADDDEDTRVSREAEEGPPAEIDEDEPVTHPDTDEPDELDALPGPAEDR